MLRSNRDAGFGKEAARYLQSRFAEHLGGGDEEDEDIFEEIDLQESVRRSMRPESRVMTWLKGVSESTECSPLGFER